MKFRILTYIASVFLLRSCLFKNDMDYPYVIGEVSKFSVEGQKNVTIDAKNRTVVVELDETADISNVRVIEAEAGPKPVGQFVGQIPDCMDLSSPYEVAVHTYGDYKWKISAVQPIERFVECPQSSRTPQFNLAEKNVLLYLMPDSNLRNVTINSMKLEKEGAEVVSTTGFELVGGEPVKKTVPVSEEDFPLTLDCTLERTFTVLSGDKEIEWKLSAVCVSGELKVDYVAPWCWSADVVAEFEGSGTPYIKYRTSGAENWLEQHEVTINGLSVSAKLAGLTEDTEYEACVASDDMVSEVRTFRTGHPETIPNMNFDDWSEKDKDKWYPNLDPSIKVWDTANGGSALMNKFPTQSEMKFVVSGKAAKLQTMEVPIVGIAAGNIYTGEFHKATLDLIKPGAELTWGVPFTGRPKALKVNYSYTPVLINYENKKPVAEPDEMDKCQILVMLTDWDGPFKVDTANGIFVDQSRNNPSIIAYAKYEDSDDTGSVYRQLELELDYWRPDATPAYAVVIACASYKGDFFTGGVGSTMYVDEFEFVYE